MPIEPFAAAFPSPSRQMSRLSDLREAMQTLQTRLATGKLAQTHGGFSTGRDAALALRGRLSEVEAFSHAIDDAATRLTAMTDALSRIGSLARAQRTDLALSTFDPGADGRTGAQVTARGRLDEMIDALNLEIGGRHLFAGRASDTRPVVPAALMLDGDGARAGLRQIIAERRAADRGADGLGRLALMSAGADVRLAQEAAGLPFGLALAGASGTGGIGAAGPAGSPPGMTLSVAGPVAEGAGLTLLLDLPDGTRETLRLTATADAALAARPGHFAIGASPVATAANLAGALADAVASLVAGPLASASSLVAARGFLAGSPSQTPARIDGPPFETATDLRPGAEADTVIWYRGEDGPGAARDTAILRADTGLHLAIGARAGEEGVQGALVASAVLAAERFAPGEDERWSALVTRVRGLAPAEGAQTPERIASEIALAGAAAASAKERHALTRNLVLDRLSAIEDAPLEETAASILSLRTRLEASYQITASLSDFSLARFLR
jgi:hypothetical protein